MPATPQAVAARHHLLRRPEMQNETIIIRADAGNAAGGSR